MLDTLGIANPETDDIPGYSVDDKDVTVVPGDELMPMAPEGENLDGQLIVDDTKEDALIDKGHEQTEDIIKSTLSIAKHISEIARDYEPRSQARMFEVGGQYYKAALDAIKLKQDVAHKTKQHNFDKAKTGAPMSVANVQQNNFYGSREEILDMLRKQREQTIEAEANNEDDS